MPVGTQGSVKAMTVRDLEDVGAPIILGNTYHLSLRPGADLIARLRWPSPLHRLVTAHPDRQRRLPGLQPRGPSQVREDGVSFRSHLDGAACELTPEGAVDIQARLGSDIAMVLDECPALPATDAALGASVALTSRWAARCRARFLALQSGASGEVTMTNPGQAQFGIVQGGISPDLRRRSAEATVQVGFEGYAIGGLSVGEAIEDMYRTVEITAPSFRRTAHGI